VWVNEVVQFRGRPMLLVEWMPQDLASLQQASSAAAAPALSLWHARRCAFELVRALRRAHERGIVHGFVGLRSVRFAVGGRTRLAQWHAAATAVRPASALAQNPLGPLKRLAALAEAGTPAATAAIREQMPYLAPEALSHIILPAAGSSQTSSELEALDAWSLGCVVAELFGGRPLFGPLGVFSASSAAFFSASTPAAVAELVRQSHARIPADAERFAAAAGVPLAVAEVCLAALRPEPAARDSLAAIEHRALFADPSSIPAVSSDLPFPTLTLPSIRCTISPRVQTPSATAPDFVPDFE
jgi:serine/threonine protein kinase